MGTPTALTPPPFCNANADGPQKGNLFRHRQMSLRRPSGRLAGVMGNANFAQLVLEKDRVRCDLRRADADIIEVLITFSAGKDYAGPMASPFCTPLEQSILTLSPKYVWKKNGAGSFALALGDERRERRHVSSRLCEHCRLLNGAKRDRVGSNDGPVSCFMVYTGA